MRFPNGTYEPEVVALMGAAYDDALQQAESRGVSLTPASRSIMASRILVLVEQGERDMSRLTALALNALDASRFPAPVRTVPAGEPDREMSRVEH